jgi:pimeloyl-ACP methyl ester carboxylesterase
MALFVIVHGGFGGGWEWADVARLLRGRGHEVFTPTLTGMGERFHLGSKLGLTTHVQDILAVLEFEDLEGVVLCGASYGGMVVTGAADRAPDRVTRVVYIDGVIPRDGESVLDILPGSFGDMLRANADERNGGWVKVPNEVLPPEDLLPDDKRARYIARLRPQPLATFTERINLTGAIDTIPRAYVRCTAGHLDADEDPVAPFARRAMAEGWPYREIVAPHDPHLFDPAGMASVLEELSREVHSKTWKH